MGIRVHKVIGWGTTNFPVKNIKEELYELYEQTADDFIKFVKENRTQLEDIYFWERGIKLRDFDIESLEKCWDKKNKKEWYGFSSFRYNSMRNKPNTIIITAPDSHHQWYRYDDIIDWIEESVSFDCRERVVDLTNKGGIYPYECGFKRIKATEPDSKYYDFLYSKKTNRYYIDTGYRNQLVGKWDKKQKPMIDNQKLIDHIKKDWRPIIPFSILAYIVFLHKYKVIKDVKEFMDRLRPMLYVYWS